MQVWKDVKGYEGIYKVSNEGKVFSIVSNRNLKQSRGSKRSPYLRVMLCKQGSKKTVMVHRLVAEAFIPNPSTKEQVNHIDGDKLNNCETNLEWVTRAENQQHAWKEGLHEHTREVLRDNGRKNIEKVNDKKRCKVIQYSLEGTLLDTFDSMRDAARSLGSVSKQGNISECCSGRRSKAYGYKWEYKEGK